MGNINCYLGIFDCLLLFFLLVVLYTRSNFEVLPADKPEPVFKEPPYVSITRPDENAYQYDSRYAFNYDPPVNPIVQFSKVIRKIKPESELYTPFDNYYEINDSEHSILDNNDQLNELNYSGGSTKMYEIPLQLNDPGNTLEQLRSQNILVTPYNKIKYC